MCEQKLEQTLCIIYSLINEIIQYDLVKITSFVFISFIKRIYGKIQENLMEIFQNENSSQKSSCLSKDLFIQTVSKSISKTLLQLVAPADLHPNL